MPGGSRSSSTNSLGSHYSAGSMQNMLGSSGDDYLNNSSFSEGNQSFDDH